MKKLSVILLSVLAVLVGWAPAQAATSSLHIAPATSKIYLYDGSPDGTGPSYPATNVSAVVKRCPAGDYLLEATLTQGGVSFPWATSGLGAGQITCSATAYRTPLIMGFYGPTLHPGRAKAHFALYRYDCSDGVCSPSDTPTVTATRVVHIPGHHHPRHS